MLHTILLNHLPTKAIEMFYDNWRGIRHMIDNVAESAEIMELPKTTMWDFKFMFLEFLIFVIFIYTCAFIWNGLAEMHNGLRVLLPRENPETALGKVDPDTTILSKGRLIQEVHYAASNADDYKYALRCMKLVERYPAAVNMTFCRNKYTAFMRACWSGNLALVRFMLKLGADVNAQSANGDTALYLAVYGITQRSGPFDSGVLDLLFHQGCSTNAAKSHGYTPLHLAVNSGKTGLVQWLLDHGADPKIATPCGLTPMQVTGNREMKALLRHNGVYKL